METGQGYELKLISHSSQLRLKPGNGNVIQLLLPIEGRRAVVSEKFLWKLAEHSFGEGSCLAEIRFGGFAPEQIGIRCISQGTSDSRLQSAADSEETFRRALPGAELSVTIVNVAGQEVSAIGVGAGHDQGRHSHCIRRQTG